MAAPNILAVSNILKNSEQLGQGLIPFLNEINQNNTQLAYDIVGIFVLTLSSKTPPFTKVKTIQAVHSVFDSGNYAAILFIEIYILPQIISPITFARGNPQIRQQMTYFEKDGYNPSIPHIQNLSFNYVRLCCQLLEKGSRVKQKRVYRGRQYSEQSLYQKHYDKLTQGKKFQHLDVSNVVDFVRQKYLLSLSRWEEYEESLTLLFSLVLDRYLETGDQSTKIYLMQMLKYGEPVVSSELIARLSQTIACSFNFKIRLQALMIFDKLILWGDAEALLLANYSQYFESIIKHVWVLEGHLSLNQAKQFYQQIDCQQQEKQLFYEGFLKCLQCWSQSFPTNCFISLDQSDADSKSPLYRVYRLLKDRRRFIFPSSAEISQFERQSHRNMHQNTIRNEMVLKDIYNQEESEISSRVIPQAFAQIFADYEVNRDCLLQMMTDSEDSLYENMRKLTEFRGTFEEKIEVMDVQSATDEDIDRLIQMGLELVDLINAIQLPYIQFLKGLHTFLEFRQILVSCCINYYHPQTKQAFRPVMSQRIIARKKMLLSTLKYQKSIPLWGQLREIVNDSTFRELRSKYRQRHNVAQSSYKSESSSSLNLEIFTKTMFSRQSRQDRLIAHNFVPPKDHSVEDRKDNKNQNKTMQNHGNEESRNLALRAQQRKKSAKGIALSKDHNFTSQQRQNTGEIKTIQNASQTGSTSSCQKQEEAVDYQIRNKTPLNQETVEQPMQQSQGTSERANNIMLKLFNIENNKDSQDSHKKEKTSYEDKNCQLINVPFEENSRYFREVDLESHKASYAYSHIIIYNSNSLIVERIVSQSVRPDSQVHVLVQLVLTPRQPLHLFEYLIQKQECIQIENISARLPQTLEPGIRYCISLVGAMRKIPMHLPTLSLYINRTLFLEYTLPFSINFFLKSCPYSHIALENYQQLRNSRYRCFISDSFKLSPTLFPRDEAWRIKSLLPTCALLTSDEKKESYLWQISHQFSLLMVVLDYSRDTKKMEIKVCTPSSSGTPEDGLTKFVCNFLSHLLAREQTL